MYVPPLGSCELGGFNELITSRFGRNLKNRMLGFPAKILPMMGFSTRDNSDIFQSPKLVSIGGICIKPFSRLQRDADDLTFPPLHLGQSLLQSLHTYNDGHVIMTQDQTSDIPRP